MPQMNKGGKWVFGWCVVGMVGEIQIPPAAYAEYGFRFGEPIVFLRGSRRSGGFSVGRLEKLAGSTHPLLRRSMGQGIVMGDGRIAVPTEAHIQPGERLLSVRGSGYAVLFITGGPIYEKALKRSDIETFIIS
jgi:hypothetical protein